MVTTALLHPVHRPPTSFLSFLTPYHHRRRRLSSSPATRYPLYYDLILSRPPPRRLSPRNHPRAADPTPPDTPFENWADRKISDSGMDKPMRKYYSKRRKRTFGSDSDDGRDGGGGGEKYIELKPEVVELPTYHAREEELYFYDAFALPWEKDKHYRMVYQLEKKYFPDQCLDKAFVDASGKGREAKDDVDKRLVFFDDEKQEKVDWDESVEKKKKKKGGSGEVGVTEKKVEEFFKCLKTVPGDGQVGRSDGEPFLATKRTGLPPRWDGPFGAVVLVNKPKGSVFLVHCNRFFSYHFVFFECSCSCMIVA